MTKHWVKVFIVAVSFCALTAHSESLTFVKSTRLIFNGNQRAVSFPLKNDTTSHYLVKGSVQNLVGHQPGDVNHNFLVLPEVLLLEPGKHQELRVVRVGGKYPQDRESVFFVNGVFVPEKQDQTSALLSLAISLNVKMFYRPPEIIDESAVKEVAKQLIFEASTKQLKVRNPTPYYATFSNLTFASYSLSNEQLKEMVPPYGEAVYSIKGIEKGLNNLSWSLIDELGNDTEKIERKLKVQ